jgi:hypothetical protein
MDSTYWKAILSAMKQGHNKNPAKNTYPSAQLDLGSKDEGTEN